MVKPKDLRNDGDTEVSASEVVIWLSMVALALGASTFLLTGDGQMAWLVAPGVLGWVVALFMMIDETK